MIWTQHRNIINCKICRWSRGDDKLDEITMKKRKETMKKDDKTLTLCGGRTGSLIFKDSDRLLVFLFSCLLFSICFKCVVMDNAHMNYLKVICEMKVMPVLQSTLTLYPVVVGFRLFPILKKGLITTYINSFLHTGLRTYLGSKPRFRTLFFKSGGIQTNTCRFVLTTFNWMLIQVISSSFNFSKI